MDRTELRSSSEKILKFKRAWQVQISHYTHVTLRKYAFLKNNQMILVWFSCIFNTSLKITSVCSINTLSSPCMWFWNRSKSGTTLSVLHVTFSAKKKHQLVPKFSYHWNIVMKSIPFSRFFWKLEFLYS